MNELDLLQYSMAWDKAIVSNEVHRIRPFMDDDWVCVATNGGLTNIDQFLGQIRDGYLIHTDMSTEESRVRIYGNSGIVTGIGYSRGTFHGKTFSFHEWSTSVFVLKDDTWRCVLTMLAAVG